MDHSENSVTLLWLRHDAKRGSPGLPRAYPCKHSFQPRQARQSGSSCGHPYRDDNLRQRPVEVVGADAECERLGDKLDPVEDDDLLQMDRGEKELLLDLGSGK